MKGCLGCLGALVVLGLLAWPIEQLRQVFGWSDAQTGGLLLATIALLAIGASERGRVDTLPATRQAAAGLRQAKAAPAAREPRPNQWPRRTGLRVTQGPLLGYQHPRGQGVGRARDPLPAQLRFSVLQRDRFRCRRSAESPQS